MAQSVTLSRPETDVDERGITRHFFEILDRNGQAVGELNIRENPEDPTEVFIEDIFMDSDEPMPLGFRGVRDLGLRIKRHFPRIKKISGGRLSGAAFQGRDIEEEISRGTEPERFTSVTIPRRFQVLD